MKAGKDAVSASPAQTRRARTGTTSDQRTPSIGVSVPFKGRRWFVALKWGQDRRSRVQDRVPHTPERRAHAPLTPTAVDHPLSRLGLVAVSTSLSIALATIIVLVYALILE